VRRYKTGNRADTRP